MENYIGNNIHAIRTNYGLSQKQLAQIAEVSQTAVSSWECGQNVPRVSNAERIVEALPDLKMDDIYSQVLGYARRVLRQSKGESDSLFGYAPLYGSIAAGAPIEMLQINEVHPVPTTLLERYPKSFYLKVSGESMNKCLPNGSYALVYPTSEVIDGAVYAVNVGGSDATVKRVRKLNNGVMLEPDSTDPTYRPQVFDYDDESHETLAVIGRVVWFCVPYDYEV